MAVQSRPAKGTPAADRGRNGAPAGRKPSPAGRKPAAAGGGQAVQKKKTKEPYKIGPFYFGGSVDIPMLVITLALLVLGITAMFSASHALSYRDNHGDSYSYATRQVGFAIAGLVFMFLISFMDYRILMHEWHPKLFGKKRSVSFAHLLFFVSFILTAATLPFGVSNIEDGPKRWLPIPGTTTSFQPSDILKVGLIIFLAYFATVYYRKMRHFTVGILVPVMFFAPAALVLVKQPHLSGLIILCVIFGGMLLVGGVNVRHLLICGVVGVGAVILLLMISDFTYFGERFITDPLADPDDTTYQTYQAILAIGSGGLWGKGFDNSTQKYLYLPEAQNDFVYAVWCEEFGFIGGVAVILLFLIFVFRGFYIGRKSDDRFGLMLATGISIQIGVQAFFNIGVNVCALPNTGISMPFFSYGGTALFMLLCEVGLLLAISRRANLN